MKLTELKASSLDRLLEAHSASQIIAWALEGRRHVNPGDYLVTVEHRQLTYKLGKWSGWQGPYWLVEVRTGVIFYGSLAYLRDVLKTSSRSFYEPGGEGTQ